MLNGPALVASRAPSATSVAGAPAEICTNVAAPSAWFVSLSRRVSARTVESLLTGSGSPMGSATSHMATWFPRVPFWPVPRTLTGAITRKSMPGNSRSSTLRRVRRKCRTAPATVASSTSLTVPPRLFLMVLTSPSGVSTHSNRRPEPISPLMGVLPVGTSHPDASEAPTACNRFPSESARSVAFSNEHTTEVAERSDRRGDPPRRLSHEELGAVRDQPRLVNGTWDDLVGRHERHQHRHQVDAGDPADHAVMDLRDVREGITGEPFDDDHLPQRA